MNTENIPCQPGLPPNATLIKTIDNLKMGASVSSKQNGSQLVAPTVNTVNYIENKEEIFISTTVWINSQAQIDSLDVYAGEIVQNAGPTKNQTMQKIYIVFDYNESQPSSLTPYTLNFELPSQSGAIQCVDVYLWNQDPETSRGTETMVQSGIKED